MTRDYMSEAQALGKLPMFFVGGLPRSGTTWVQQLLNAHPQLVCLGESHFINDLLPSLVKTWTGYAERRAEGRDTWAPTVRGPTANLARPVFHAAFVALVQENLEGRSPGDLVAIGEKTPDNIMHVREIWTQFPQARFVNVIRDGRDGAISAFIRFQSKLAPKWSRADYLEAYAKGWSSRIAAARKLAPGHQYHEIRYEAMHADPEGEAGRLFRFLGAGTEQPVVQAALAAASFEKLSGGRRRGEEDATSHYRRGEVGGWAETLTAEELAVYEAIAGPMMDELGYARGAGRA